MADFVAVIRRAVDGLSDNTPEMRAKVYDKARSAVLRQLESMKPRPPEEMLRRQLDKLEAAIGDVESEHAEALPAFGETSAEHDHPAEAFHAGLAPEPIEHRGGGEDRSGAWGDGAPQGHDHEAAPHAEDAGAPPPEEHAWQQPGEQAGEWTPERHEERGPDGGDAAGYHPAADEPAVESHAVTPEREEPQTYWHEPVQPERHAAGTVSDHERDAGGEPLQALAHPAPPPEQSDEWQQDAEPAVYPDELYDLPDEPVRAHAERPVGGQVDQQPISGGYEREPMTETPVEDNWFSPEPPPRTADVARTRAQDEFDDFLRESEEAANRTARETGAAAKMPAATDFLAWDESPFDDISSPGSKTVAGQTAAALPAAASPAKADADVPAARNGTQASSGGWDDLQDLIGQGKADDREMPPPDLAEVVARRQTKSFRAEPKRRINYGAIVFALAGLVVLGGAGYAAWMNREMLSGMVTGLVSSASRTGSEKTSEHPVSGGQTPADTGKGAEQSQGGATAAGGGKFTQRLLADGREVDTGPASQPGESTEGKSVAQQNVASSAGPTVESGQAPAQTVTGNGPIATPQVSQVAPVGASQKMFLYEERLGQSLPTAIEGTVSWSLQEEPGAGGKPEPTVQGHINVPDRGLSALLTFKRNSDSSLPASHLVEIVFSLPKDFEGGSIDSVQRISMKQTEQDRGNPLIAVPAKITDDFHMIALNDFPEAMKTNLELMRTRNWIDIPITYRNGRRALLTLDKGTAGTDAFNTAIKEWNARGPVPSSQ